VRLVFDAGDRPEPALYANVEQPFVFVDSEGRPHDARSDWAAAVGSLATAVGQSVTEATVAPDGTLDVAFSDGRSFSCHPHPDYEAWQVVGGTPAFLIVCVPGGGEPAIFSSSRTMTLEEANADPELNRLAERFGMPPPDSPRREDG
jgi:hypothetical protein